MKRILVLACLVGLVLVAAYTVITVYDDNLKIGRMWETPAVRPHEQPLLVMDAGAVPVSGGEAFYRLADPDSIQPEMEILSDASVDLGKKAYFTFCAQCHGPNHDGYGTVGQSFHPPPGDLRSAKVQNQSAGRIFHEISYGRPGGRQPALATTIAVPQRWQIVGYVQSLGKR